MSYIIVDDISKTFKVAKRNSGLKSALKSFIKREYTIVEAVKNISFEINEGEIVGYIGPNGAGKSTTIKMLSEILLPTAGNIKVNGLNPFVSLLVAMVAGLLAGAITGFLHTRCEIPAILAGILTQLGLYSINLRIISGGIAVVSFPLYSV